MKNLLLLAIAIFGWVNLNAQTSKDKFWSASPESTIKQTGKRQIVPQKYLTFKLNGTDLKDKLFLAPNEKDVKINESACIITLPLPNGTMQQFKVVESPIMEPGLASQFPDMKTFSIKGIDDVYANGKLDWNEFGFHGMVRTVNGDFFIDPYCLGNLTDYISYYTSDFVQEPSQRIPEVGVIKHPENSQGKNTPKKKEQNEEQISNTMPAGCVGAQLRTYRLAVACTGEYAVAATGTATPTVAQTLAKIVTSVNRVDGVFETEVSVRMVLVATETMVVFTNAGTDPFTGNMNSNTLINESQTVITNTIGNGNFDIGHTFSTGAGGLAGLGVVCSGTKGEGVTGDLTPVGDPYDIDYVAHEIGHQFGGDHTFNSLQGSCGGSNRNSSTSVEPGSGLTLMAYAGLCNSDNIVNNSIPYFHAISYDQIVGYVNSVSGNLCVVTSTTGNNPPVVTGAGNYIIPKSTAFVLAGSATDMDGDALTYSWEQTDAGISGGTWNSGNRPYFRTYSPTTTATRYFPKGSIVLNGNATYTTTKGEFVPSIPQTLHFRLSARDNKVNGGGVCYAINTVTVDASGPFVVSSPNTNTVTWYLTGLENVTWSVNGTDAAPVSCDTVRILISYNSGLTYSVLLNSTPNDGSQVIAVPTVTAPISTCRIKIEGKGNIFYDISDTDFTISDVTSIRKNSISNPLGLIIWPNPFSSEFNLIAEKLNSVSPTNLRVIDLLGKNILEINYQNKSELNEKINLDKLARGVYFISITNNNNHSVYRIIKD